VYICESEVRAALNYADLIPAIRRALIDYSAGRVEQPPRPILRVTDEETRNTGWLSVMPVIAEDFMAVKTVTFFPLNARHGMPTHMATIELLNRSTGEPLAVMDGRLITEMRTAAVSAVAFATLSPLHFATAPTRLGILGSGVQARSHIEALQHLWPGLRDIGIWSRTQAHAERLAGEMGARAVTIEEAASAEVVLVAVAASEPVLMGRWLSANALVLSIGAIGVTQRELDDEVMSTSSLIVESRAGAEQESGDVRHSGAKVVAEIGEILSGNSPAQIPHERRILFKSLGMAIEDLTAARLVWQARQLLAQR
jgi:thiomorpholine-carboxylate dehydrogenase